MSATVIKPAIFCQGHLWQESYYGWTCAHCDAFAAFGCEPWMVDDYEWSGMDDFADEEFDEEFDDD